MTRTGVALRMAFVFGGLALAVGSAAAQEAGGGLLPGANTVHKAGTFSTCSARNAPATKQCSTTCPAGQTADCTDSDDGSDPTCACSGG